MSQPNYRRKFDQEYPSRASYLLANRFFFVLETETPLSTLMGLSQEMHDNYSQASWHID